VAGKVRPSSEAQGAREQLERALEGLSDRDFFGSMQAIAEEIPLAVGSDFVNLRLLSDEGDLHLVGASGCSSIEVRKRAFHPLELEAVQAMLESGGHDEVARSLGIPWIHVVWLRPNGGPLGTIAVGSRTKRRPTDESIEYLQQASMKLARRLYQTDRSEHRLETCSLRLARLHKPPPWPSDVDPVSLLRPRERNILELYADGLTTEEVAELLVISRHTVRTHVRNALRTLAVHSREEAATIVRSDQLSQLL
jgi:DNA-binding CsgD family transcriptional regulator